MKNLLKRQAIGFLFSTLVMLIVSSPLSFITSLIIWIVGYVLFGYNAYFATLIVSSYLVFVTGFCTQDLFFRLLGFHRIRLLAKRFAVPIEVVDFAAAYMGLFEQEGVKKWTTEEFSHWYRVGAATGEFMNMADAMDIRGPQRSRPLPTAPPLPRLTP